MGKESRVQGCTRRGVIVRRLDRHDVRPWARDPSLELWKQLCCVSARGNHIQAMDCPPANETARIGNMMGTFSGCKKAWKFIVSRGADGATGTGTEVGELEDAHSPEHPATTAS
jgi:hypothetical protein